MMKRICCILLTAAAVLMLAGCGAGEKAPGSYRQISMEEAVSMMERETDYILLDVRTLREGDFETIVRCVVEALA